MCARIRMSRCSASFVRVRMRCLNAAQWWKNDWGHLCWSFDKIRRRRYQFSPNLLARSDKCARTLLKSPEQQRETHFHTRHAEQKTAQQKEKKKRKKKSIGVDSAYSVPLYCMAGSKPLFQWAWKSIVWSLIRLGFTSHWAEEKSRTRQLTVKWDWEKKPSVW